MMLASRHNGAQARRTRVASRGRAARRAPVIALALILLVPVTAAAADLGDTLRGSLPNFVRPSSAIRWDGVVFGGQLGYANLSADFTDSTSTSGQLPRGVTTNSATYGAFLGYNTQWDDIILGVDVGYNRPSSMMMSTSGGGTTGSLKLDDYGTFRGRAGYVLGQFMPYAFVGGAVGRMNYAIAPASSASQTASRDNAYSFGATAGLGVDVAILPNVFLRAEYEYIVFSPVGQIRSSTNAGRVGVGLRF
jgi:outer membrane immunogenic protein